MFIHPLCAPSTPGPRSPPHVPAPRGAGGSRRPSRSSGSRPSPSASPRWTSTRRPRRGRHGSGALARGQRAPARGRRTPHAPPLRAPEVPVHARDGGRARGPPLPGTRTGRRARRLRPAPGRRGRLGADGAPRARGRDPRRHVLDDEGGAEATRFGAETSGQASSTTRTARCASPAGSPRRAGTRATTRAGGARGPPRRSRATPRRRRRSSAVALLEAPCCTKEPVRPLTVPPSAAASSRVARRRSSRRPPPIHVRTDRLFARLMVVQWVAGDRRRALDHAADVGRAVELDPPPRLDGGVPRRRDRSLSRLLAGPPGRGASHGTRSPSPRC